MQKALIILGTETKAFSGGQFNRGLFDMAVEMLSTKYEVTTTIIEEGYDVDEEIAKFKAADVVIYQYPIYWFMPPSAMKLYLDEVYRFGDFFGFTDGPYGSGGMMQGKKLMLSTTWNSPKENFGDEDGFYRGKSMEDMLLPIIKSHEYCGFEVLPLFSSHDVVKNADYASDASRYAEHLKKTFDL
ncbi:NAD(P)H-dependent oxidoreductase [Pseudovibrio exalbescens]|uniref:NAD(P)H-dependent oxidoreductase n=1 Tax=Pseudovibrio exalbescens TaxID=197461 RepID=UPI0023668EC6|nr:NAD(P)H-dependent oxidoreductase [Pseudovibrio exalbescens]MDD7911235.1 NAD(P)H-dependent oxidoreductase [Pseudovibrio exalbescens]